MIGNTKLLVIIPDRISSILKKGEYPERYYNPENLFDEVHILMTNKDKPDLSALQKTVGDAKLYLYNLPFTYKDFFFSLGMQPWALKQWTQPGLDLARKIIPQLVRCHGDGLNAFLAYRIKNELGIPYVVSIHTAREDHLPGKTKKISNSLVHALLLPIRRLSLRGADIVLPVYKSAVPFLKNIGVKRYEVAYNVINPKYLRKKKRYELHDPVSIVYVGRLNEHKNPVMIILALKSINHGHLTIIGDGPLRPELERLSNENRLSKRISFVPALPNDELCELLPEFDIFAIHSNHSEIPKTLLEALLTGLPCIVNQRTGNPVPELQAAPILMVNNSVEGYATGIRNLIDDDSLRSQLGRKAKAHASKHWAPSKTEARYAAIYKEILYKVRKP